MTSHKEKQLRAKASAGIISTDTDILEVELPEVEHGGETMESMKMKLLNTANKKDLVHMELTPQCLAYP
eukprot:4808632-Karenia_brevis.AAC.1